MASGRALAQGRARDGSRAVQMPIAGAPQHGDGPSRWHVARLESRLAAPTRYNSLGVEHLSRRTFLGVAGIGLAGRLAGSDKPVIPLAVTTDEIDDDLAVALAFHRRFGLKHCEIRHLWGRYNTSQPVEKIREARNMLDDSGISLAILDTGFFKVPLPASGTLEGSRALRKQWDLLDRAFERADILGTRLIRTFAFTYGRNEDPDPNNYPRIYELVAESAARARAAGFRLAVENVAGSYVETAAQSADLLREVPSTALGLTWDPNNSARAGDPEPFPAGYERLEKARILHVHVRDYRKGANGEMEWCGVGDGEFDHVGQLRALLRDGYRGVVSLETHYKIDGSKAAASEHSLKGLLRAVDRV